MKSKVTLPAIPAIAAFSLCALLSFGLTGCEGAGARPRIGVSLYSMEDSSIAAARRSLEAAAAGKARVSVLDAQNQSAIQGEQISAMIADKAKAIIVNPVNATAMSSLVFQAKAANVPLVLFSRSINSLPIIMWDKAYFVGVRGEEADALQVEILVDYWRTHSEADKNGDGKIQYILLRGEQDQEASRLSAQSRRDAFAAAGIQTITLTELSVKWTRAEAQEKLASRLSSLDGKTIEAVLCGNDELALGAIEALKVAGFFKGAGGFVPVIGIDGTRFALDAIAEGQLLGTVRADASSQGKAAFDLAYALAQGTDPAAAGWVLTDGKYVLVPFQKVTAENYRNFLN
jgi:methyl-galactoside transport system substrate-binding protein